MDQVRAGLLTILACAAFCGCTPKQGTEPASESAPAEEPPAVAEPAEEPTPEVVLEEPVALWENGASDRRVDAVKADEEQRLLLDLGDDWTPFIFTESLGPDGEVKPMDYRETYLALARGEHPKDRHGDRARRDKYLELYGILPTLSLLRTRFGEVEELACSGQLDLTPLLEFDGFLAYRPGRRPQRRLNRYKLLHPQMETLAERLGVETLDEVTESTVSEEEWEKVEEYRILKPEIEAIAAAQARLQCEGFFEGKGAYVPGLFDWRTHEALAEFERRHRVYGWGFIGDDTLALLQKTPQEAEQEAVIRVLTERAMHAAQVIEDGSTSTSRDGEPRTYKTEDGEERQIPNFEGELRDNVIAAFGLETPESTKAWLDSLGDIGATQIVAVQGIDLPPYYGDDMELLVTIDRGDIWYEFPFDENGKPRSQPVSRRPRVAISVKYNDQKIPLARFGTTVGGWRGEFVEGQVMWKYKDSPVGRRVWSRIAAAPVWVPPESTPPKVLLAKNRKGDYEVNYHDTGPSYASAYGLVAAYHRKSYRGRDGEVQIGGDEGIRTHGSVDYMSIMRRHSHGCHRMHNHIAVRLMSFVLEHRPHTVYGHQPMIFQREFEFEDETYMLEFEQGGYNYVLDVPVPVEVLEGRIRGKVQEPIEHHMPRYDKEVEAYVMPDGEWVTVDRYGNLTPRVKPFDFDAPLEAPTLDPVVADPDAESPTTPGGVPIVLPPSATPEPTSTPSTPAAATVMPVNTAPDPATVTP
ncbi:MAG: L,D-transpeptidase [Myxococcota bacterium]